MKRFVVIGGVLALMALVLAACPSSGGGAATPTTAAETPTTAPTTVMTATEAATETPMVTGTAVMTSTPAMTGTPMMTGTPAVTGTAMATETPMMTGTAVMTSTPAMTGTPTMTSTPAVTDTTTTTATTGATGGAAMTETVMLATDQKLGQILTDGAGRTLYLFTNDTGSTSTCSGKCATNWPAFTVADTAKAGSGVDQSLLGATTGADGKKQATYNGHPLYYYIKDTKAGDTTGQGVGDVWYVVDAKGNKVE